MMKKNNLIVLFLLCSIYGFSQEPSITWGLAQTNDDLEKQLTEIVAADETGFYCLKPYGPISNHHTLLVKYDKAFKEVYSKDIEYYKEGGGVLGDANYFRNFIFKDAHFLKFTEHWLKAKLTSTYFVQIIGKDGEVAEKHIQLDQNKAEKLMKAPRYKQSLSPDGSKLVLLTQFNFVKKTNEKLKIKVFNTSTWEEISSKDIELDYLGKRGVLNDIAIDNEGNVYMTKRVKHNKAFEHVIYTLSKSGDWNKTDLGLGEKHLLHKELTFNKKDECILTGYYGLGNGYDISGTVYYRINPTSLKIEAKSIEAFGSSVASQLAGKKTTAGEKFKLSDFKLRDVLHADDGSTILVSEKYREEKKLNSAASAATGSAAKTVYDYTYHAGNIMVISINSDGSRKWSQAVHKSQVESNQDGSGVFDSFNWFLKDNKLSIFYNNHELNKLITDRKLGPEWVETDGVKHYKNREFSTNCRIATFMYQIDANGTMKHSNLKYGLPLKSMHQKSSFAMSMKPRLLFPTKDGLIIMSAMNRGGKRYKFGLINP